MKLFSCLLLCLVALAGCRKCDNGSCPVTDTPWKTQESWEIKNQTDQEKLVLLSAHNKVRRQNSVNQLSYDYQLDRTAQEHADWMAASGMMSHIGKNNSTVADRSGRQYVSENIAYGYRNVQEVMQGWIHSYGHFNNIVNPDTNIVGFGIARAKNGTLYWCAVFSRN